MNINLGCGESVGKGYDVGMDKVFGGPNIITHDMEDIPWPIETNTATRVRCSHVLEHICPRRIFDVMNEIHRICKPSAEVIIMIPRANTPASGQDPSHCSNGWSEKTVEYFCPEYGPYQLYKCKPFRKKEILSAQDWLRIVLEVVK